MDLKQTKAAVEAMLFAHAEPVTAERLAGVLGVEEDAVSRLLLSLRDDYEAEDRGLVLLQNWRTAGNLQNSLCAVHIEISHGHAAQHAAFSAALEVHKPCAYNQPVSARAYQRLGAGRGFFVPQCRRWCRKG